MFEVCYECHLGSFLVIADPLLDGQVEVFAVVVAGVTSVSEFVLENAVSFPCPHVLPCLVLIIRYWIFASGNQGLKCLFALPVHVVQRNGCIVPIKAFHDYLHPVQ